MDEHVRFEHNSKVTTLVVAELVCVGCASCTLCSVNPRNRSRPVTTATKASTQINETQYKSMNAIKINAIQIEHDPSRRQHTKHKKEAMSTTINTINTANTAINNTIQSETKKNTNRSFCWRSLARSFFFSTFVIIFFTSSPRSTGGC